MKKTLTVNLGGSVFHIDEDAYQLLDKYLSNLRDHFRRGKDSEEIMGDFEVRISELFGERVRLGYEVITIREVEEVIKRIGKPEELFENDEYTQEKEEEDTSKTISEKKRLMRDPENRIFGGVAAGIAAYMNVDATVVRLVMLLSFFIPYVPLVIPYLILWLIIPPATTAAEKLQMRGEKVTLENIGKTVTDGFDKFSGDARSFMQSDKPRNFLQKLADLFVAVVGFILKFIAVLIAIIVLPILLLVLFVLFILIIALIGGGSGMLYHMSPFGGDWLAGAPLPLTILGGVSMLFLIGIPVLILVYAITQQLFKFKPLPSAAKWTILVLWILSILVFAFYVGHTGLQNWNSLPWNSTNYLYNWS